MLAQTSTLLLISLAAVTLAQGPDDDQPIATGTYVANGITVDASQFTDAANAGYSLLVEFATATVYSDAYAAFSSAGYSDDAISSAFEDGADQRATLTNPLAAIIYAATADPTRSPAAIETALPASLRSAFDATQQNLDCEIRQAIRNALGLPSDAIATQCVMPATTIESISVPGVTGTFVTDGFTVDAAQITQAVENAYSVIEGFGSDTAGVYSNAAAAFSSAGYSEDAIYSEIDNSPDGAPSTLGPLANILYGATANPHWVPLPEETALPTTIKTAYDNYQEAFGCQLRQAIRSGLGLPSDAYASECAMTGTTAAQSTGASAQRTGSQSTGGAALARPTDVSMLVGSMFAAGMVGAAAVLL